MLQNINIKPNGKISREAFVFLISTDPSLSNHALLDVYQLYEIKIIKGQPWLEHLIDLVKVGGKVFQVDKNEEADLGECRISVFAKQMSSLKVNLGHKVALLNQVTILSRKMKKRLVSWISSMIKRQGKIIPIPKTIPTTDLFESIIH